MRIIFFRLATIIIGLIILQSNVFAQSQLDSVKSYIDQSNNKESYNYNSRLYFARKAHNISIDKGEDSLILKTNLNLSLLYLENNDNIKFKHLSWSNLKLAKKIKDTSALAVINKKFGGYYKSKMLADSAYYYYYQAEKLFRSLNDKYNIAAALLNIAIIQKNEKDFTGSELTSVEAISLLESLNDTNKVILVKAFVYNNLGLVFGELEQYEESIKYYKKALELKGELKGNNSSTIANSHNNLALSYKKSGQYNLAIQYYNKILEKKNLLQLRPGFYALVLDNYAHTLYLSERLKLLPNLYLKALKISDSISEAGYNSIIINQHLAEYYHDNNQNDSAKYYAYRAKDISERYHNDDLLKSLLLLSEIEVDSMASIHLKAYVKLSDSLQKNERAIRNKFARIQYETEQIEQENIQIAKERLWLLIISVVVVIASFLLYLVITQRNKNRELQFVQKQQETNEEIYNLMLSQNETIEEARTLEKKRISQELHDGILGRLFGTRLSLDSLNMNNTVEAIKTRSEYIDGLKTIEEDIRKVSHELNTDFVSGSGFIDIIKTLIETQTLAYGLKYDLKHDDAITWDALSNKKKIHIYRIVQESLHNIYKHAKATQVSISFKLKKNVICFTLKDDGSGFDVTKAKSGIGLRNMNSRIKEIAGNIDIKSEINIGTTVIIEFPTTEPQIYD